MKAQRKQCQTPNAKKGNPLQSEKLQRQKNANWPSYCGKAVYLGLGDLKANHMFWKDDFFRCNELFFWDGTMADQQDTWLHGLVCLWTQKWGWIAVAKHKHQKQGKNNMTKLPTLDLKGCHWTIWWIRVGKDTGFRLLVYRLIWVGSPSRTQTPLVFGPVKRTWPIFARVLADFKWVSGDVKRCLSYPYLLSGNPERFWSAFEQIQPIPDVILCDLKLFWADFRRVWGILTYFGRISASKGRSHP